MIPRIAGHSVRGKGRKLEIPFTEEEIRNSKGKSGGRPLAEILGEFQKRDLETQAGRKEQRSS